MASPIQVSFEAPISRARKAEVVRRTRQRIAIELFKDSTWSAGLAAKMCGLTYRDFLELLRKEGVTYSRPVKGATAAGRRALSGVRRRGAVGR